jgi:hypothetical protein
MNLPNWAFVILNTALMAVQIYLIASQRISPGPVEWTRGDVVTILLTCLAVILAALALFVGALAILGFSAFRDMVTQAAIDIAARKAQEVAAMIASWAATATMLDSSRAGVESDALTKALIDEGQKNAARH